MAKLSEREKQAIINSLITAMALARHSLSPTQTRMATRSAGELLWLLNIPEFTADGLTFATKAPEGATVDLAVTQQIVTMSVPERCQNCDGYNCDDGCAYPDATVSKGGSDR